MLQSSNLNRVGAKLLVAFVAFGWSAFSLADKEEIKYRQSVYSAIGSQMGAMASIIKGEVAHKDDLPTLAAGLAGLAALTPDLFPENSQAGKTKALPLIWEEFDAFSDRLDELQIISAELAKISQGNDMREFAHTLSRLGRACKGCHDRFKAE